MVIKRYNYPSFPGFADVRPFRERLDLKVGQEAPDFTGNVLETGSITLSQLRDLAHVVLEFGSITSPQFCAGVPELEALRAEFEPKGFRFLSCTPASATQLRIIPSIPLTKTRLSAPASAAN